MNDQTPVQTISIDAPAPQNQPPEIQIPVGNNAFVDFIKKRKVLLFIGLVVVTLGLVAFLAQPGSELKTQLIPDNSAVVIPTDPTDETPPVVVSTNENTNQTNENTSPLIGLTTDPIVPATVENKNANTANTNANKKYTFVHASAPENGTGTVNYDPSHQKFLNDLDQQGQKTNLHPGAPISGEKSTRSGPETEIAFLLSCIVGFLFLVLSKRKQKLNSLR